MISNIGNSKLIKAPSNILLLGLIIFLLYAYFFLNSKSADKLPVLTILPEVPSSSTVKIMALGDEQFYFRTLAIQLQNAGDSFGRFTKLQNYDYKLLKKWFLLLDTLDSKSSMIPSLAAYYYSNTQNVSDNRYLIEYLEENFNYDPAKKWWWLSQAALIAQHKLRDNDLAIRLAFKVSSVEARLPRWAQQLPAILYAQKGENHLALQIMKDLASKYDDYTDYDVNYMNHFIKERLGFKDEITKKN